MTLRFSSIVVVSIFMLAVFCLAYLNFIWYKDSQIRLAVFHEEQHHQVIIERRVYQSSTANCDHDNQNRSQFTTVSPAQPITKAASIPLPWIFAITPTYTRHTQIVDLTSLCQTLQLVPNLVWIVIEDSYLEGDTVTDLLNRCSVTSVHLTARNISEWTSPAGRGVAQRNAGLTWIRENCHKFSNCNGSFYFMDDDNKYGLELFNQIRKVQFIGIWPVAYAGFLYFEGPVCVNNKIVEWHVLFAPERKFPIDMAGFGVNIKMLLDYPEALFGYNPHSREKARGGWQETKFLENFSTGKDDPRIECRGSDKQAFVWHIKTKIDMMNASSDWRYDIRTR